MDRRSFIGSGALALAGSVANGAAPDRAARVFPTLRGAEFSGMEGIHAPLFTPIGADGRVDEAKVAPTVERLLSSGVAGFYVGGSTGEGLLLTVAERKRMLKRVAAENRRRGKLIAHVGAVSTDDSVELARAAADLGYDWVSAIQPVFFGQDFESVRRHYERIAGSTDLPFMIYSRGATVDPDRDAKLFDIPNVKGMKYTGHDYWEVVRLRRRLGKEAIFFAGSDQQVLSAFAIGDLFSGAIGTTYNAIPMTILSLFRSVEAGCFVEARRHQADIIAFVEVCKAYGFGGFKAAMRFVGLDQGPCVGPNRTLSSVDYATFSAKLAKMDFVPRTGGVR